MVVVLKKSKTGLSMDEDVFGDESESGDLKRWERDAENDRSWSRRGWGC